MFIRHDDDEIGLCHRIATLPGGIDLSFHPAHHDTLREQALTQQIDHG